MSIVFVDTDVFLDFFLGREPFATHAAHLFDVAAQGCIKVYTTGVIFSNLYYILHDLNKRARVREMLHDLRGFVLIQSVDVAVIDQALASPMKDFEDAIQYYAALAASADFIVTRNKRDYAHSLISIVTAEEWLGFYSSH